jgi:hypothetical protein
MMTKSFYFEIFRCEFFIWIFVQCIFHFYDLVHCWAILDSLLHNRNSYADDLGYSYFRYREQNVWLCSILHSWALLCFFDSSFVVYLLIHDYFLWAILHFFLTKSITNLEHCCKI